ncbi:hypothetical protein AQUCO_02500085v1 [Aquilegia coerulea]|uniref:C2 domain-containing protein n=3 Tax=Aquilegia coerulea TaxID=218851 RepID=A0A2G5D9D6_AQUCA|nr:hypothetical protein AQUCO_02500085v1 [Aquilegia coerulea]
MVALQLHLSFNSLSHKLLHFQNYNSLSPPSNRLFFKQFSSPKVRISNSRNHVLCCFGKLNSYKQEEELISEEKEKIDERPGFDINLAVILAGFAFEAYWSPPEKVGTREVDSANCQTVFLSEEFLRQVYDGHLFIKLKKGVNFPAMDPWGTSDPYVVMQLDGQVVKSNVKWATKDPIWNEDFTLNIKIPTTKSLQVAAWDANLVTPHKRMGNSEINLESFCDGTLHEVVMELEGLGGGGRIHLEVKYRSFDEVDEEKAWWRIPYITDFLANNDFESTFKKIFGSDTVTAQQFVQYAFRQIKSFNPPYEKNQLPRENFINLNGSSNLPLQQASSPEDLGNSLSAVDESQQPLQLERSSEMKGKDNSFEDIAGRDGKNTSLEKQVDESMQSDIWKNFGDVINQTVVRKLGFPVLDKIRLDGFDLVNRAGLESKKVAEAAYVDSGLATPGSQGGDVGIDDQPSVKVTPPSFLDIKKLSWDVIRQTDSILGALMVLNSTFSQHNNATSLVGKNEIDDYSSTNVMDGVSGSTSERVVGTSDDTALDKKKEDVTKALFSTAESAMEAWAMLATSLGHPSFIKSEFEKICFLDNPSTDTQVAIWRDTLRKRLVIAFRGTEQTRWRDLVTDLMLVPAGLNPERVGGDFKQEVQVHSGFLSAYDSVRTRLMSLIKLSVGFVDDNIEAVQKWRVYVTGHSLGGALATLLALELSSSQMAKNDAISVTMYNFGSPRVGNRRFVDVYNEKVKDSWRIVNHRDIIPTVPRLMGYCHVAHPVYLSAGDLPGALENMELVEDGYQADVIGEYTPDVLVGEFMKGERELVEKILQTEINLFRAIRDGSALMQHMEDFYYISLLENVRSNYKTVGISNHKEEDSI